MNNRGDEPQLLLPFKRKVDYEVSPRSASTATTKNDLFTVLFNMALEDAHIVYEEEEEDDDQTTATTRLPPQATCGLSCNMSSLLRAYTHRSHTPIIKCCDMSSLYLITSTHTV